jgi:hypothetical protein
MHNHCLGQMLSTENTEQNIVLLSAGTDSPKGGSDHQLD